MPENEEKIRTSLNTIDSEVLKDALAILLSRNSTPAHVPQTESVTDYKNFAQAILDLKRKYKFKELDFFTTEADLVYVQAGDRRVLLTDRTVTPPERPAAPAAAEKKETPSEKSENSRNEENSPENAFEPVVHSDSRFSHLEF